MLHCGKFYIDFHDINLNNSTLVTSGDLNVNGGRIWVHERREFWFTDLWNNPGLHEIRWKEDFRMTRPTFEYIVLLVRPFITKRDTRFRKTIPVEKRAAIALWRLATGNSYGSIAKNFAVAKSTAVEITKGFCKCITEMASDFIVFPKTEGETAEAIIRFAEFSNCKIPQVVGAIDGVQIEVIGPRNDSKVDYLNRKQQHSTNTMATIGANLDRLPR